jgi:hypothetical protein
VEASARARAGARARIVALVAVLGAATTAGCIGSETRESFDDEVHARGGGLTQELVIEAVDAVEEDTGADALKLRSFTTSAGRVSLEVQVPGSLEDLDSYSFGSSGLYGGGGLDGPDPVARSGTGALPGRPVRRPRGADHGQHHRRHQHQLLAAVHGRPG